MVDQLFDDIPSLEEDMYWDQPKFQIPYTLGSEKFKKDQFTGSGNEVV